MVCREVLYCWWGVTRAACLFGPYARNMELVGPKKVVVETLGTVYNEDLHVDEWAEVDL